MRRTILLKNPGLSDFSPLFCGWEQCLSGCGYGPAVRDYYLIHCVLAGKGIFNNGKQYRLERGDCFIIRPGELVFYRPDEADPWRYCWIGFTGGFAETLLRRAHIEKDSPIFHNSEILKMFENLCDRIQNSQLSWASGGLFLLAMMFSIFSFLPQKEMVRDQKREYITEAKNYISAMVPLPFSVEQLAEFCGLDRHYLVRIFKQQTGFTLQQYIISLRVKKACELLRSSRLSVGDISRSVGYRDVYSFSKTFKKQTGLSPREYRKSCLEGIIGNVS